MKRETQPGANMSTATDSREAHIAEIHAIMERYDITLEELESDIMEPEPV